MLGRGHRDLPQRPAGGHMYHGPPGNRRAGPREERRCCQGPGCHLGLLSQEHVEGGLSHPSEGTRCIGSAARAAEAADVWGPWGAARPGVRGGSDIASFDPECLCRGRGSASGEGPGAAALCVPASPRPAGQTQVTHKNECHFRVPALSLKVSIWRNFQTKWAHSVWWRPDPLRRAPCEVSALPGTLKWPSRCWPFVGTPEALLGAPMLTFAQARHAQRMVVCLLWGGPVPGAGAQTGSESASNLGTPCSSWRGGKRMLGDCYREQWTVGEMRSLGRWDRERPLGSDFGAETRRQ